MAAYSLNQTDTVVRNVDGALIPNDPSNRDRIEYVAWLANGGVPDPYVRPAEEIAQDQRRAAFNSDASRADLLTRLRSATPAQISAYVDTNVTNLADARALFKRILLVLAQV
ncbi:MAG: hypothetical protein WC807_14495 [Hyphomicrobium sp.]|jgi:hypothetical protein